MLSAQLEGDSSGGGFRGFLGFSKLERLFLLRHSWGSFFSVSKTAQNCGARHFSEDFGWFW